MGDIEAISKLLDLMLLMWGNFWLESKFNLRWVLGRDIWMLFSLSMLNQTAVLHKKLKEMEVLEANVEKWKKKHSMNRPVCLRETTDALNLSRETSYMQHNVFVATEIWGGEQEMVENNRLHLLAWIKLWTNGWNRSNELILHDIKSSRDKKLALIKY